MPPIPHLIATACHRELRHGKTKPVILTCEDGQGNCRDEYVVKLKAGVQGGSRGLVCELISSILAQLLGVPVPDPAIVHIDPALAATLPQGETTMASALARSDGANFGTRVLTGGYRNWPVDMAIPTALRQAAADIFAFDALIENPDRRFDNPNVLWSGEEVFAIDHESAFSFIYALDTQDNPWEMKSHAFLDRHVFFRGLKGVESDLSGFTVRLEAVSDEALSQMASEVPGDWESDRLMTILGHIKSMRDHAPVFAEKVKRRLA